MADIGLALPAGEGVRVRPHVSAALAWLLLAVSVFASTVALPLARRAEVVETHAVDGVLLLAMVGFAAVGALIVLRRRGNRIGWMMLVIGATFSLGIVVDTYAVLAHQVSSDPPASAVWAAWVASWGWGIPVLLLFVFLPLLFPDGRLPSSRWRPVAWAGLALVIYPVAEAFRPGPMLWYEEVTISDNPLGVDAVLPVLAVLDHAEGIPLLLVLLAVIACLTYRWRRSRGVERQQLKWFLAATTLLACGFLAEILSPVPGAVFGFVVFAMPVAVGMAVLHYRLYDIDRIIRRTVAYAVLTVLLVGIYVAGVLGLGALVRAVTGGGGGDLVVAASTLGVAAAFVPLRRRIQTLVDRRFNRSRYDAQQAIDQFAQQLRNEVDLDTLGGDLLQVADDTLQPSMIGLWLRSEATP